MRGTESPDDRVVAAMQRGVASMRSSSAQIVFAGDFDAAVRSYTGSSTYTADRGTGTVAAKTLKTPHGSVIVVNAVAIEAAEEIAIERLLAHEAGHVLMLKRGETLEGHRHLASAEWEWHLLCLAGFALDEARVELAVGAAGYPGTDGASAEHLVEVLHATTVDLLVLLQDPASSDVRHLMERVIGLLDRLTKVLAYAAAHAIVTGQPPDVSGQGSLALAAWDDYAAPTWARRLTFYSDLPPATVPMSAAAQEAALTAGLVLEQDLLRDIGFAFEDAANGGFGFFRRVEDAQLHVRMERAIAQERAFEANESADESGG